MIITKEWLDLVNDKMKDWNIKVSPKDERDFPLEAIIPLEALQNKASLDYYIPYVLDQLTCPFCAGFSIVSAFNAYFNSKGLMPKGGFSSKFVYWKSKEIDGIPNLPGTYLRAILKIAQQIGICPEYMLPFNGDCSKPVITDEMLKEASKYKIKTYAKLNGYDEIARAIAAGKFTFLASIVTSEDWKDGWILEPDGTILGGHATLGIGYDKNLKYTPKPGQYYEQFIDCLNSWSKNWGINGRYWMSKKYTEMKMQDLNVCPLMEAWTIEFETNLVSKQVGIEYKEFDVIPFEKDGRTMIEMRELAELTGGVIEWSKEKPNDITIVYPDKTVYLKIGEKQYRIEYK